MSELSLSYTISNTTNSPTLILPGSKSIANRLLILKAQYPVITIKNLPNSDDVSVLKNALQNQKNIINIGHAGTAMRFLTAYYSFYKKQPVTLTGSNRMKQRPIGILVDALQSLGATIKYEEKQGFPPLTIVDKKIQDTNKVVINGSVSSQYITALMLVAPKLPKGLTIHLTNKLTSQPYLTMTQALLQKIGVTCHFKNSVITVLPQPKINPISIEVESDWSSASYFYSLIALSKKSVTLSKFSKNSIQGDTQLVSLYTKLNVLTTFNASANSITLQYQNSNLPKEIIAHLNDTPDLAQTLVVTCLGLGIPATLTGLKTLRIKETNRLEALKTELEKLGATVTLTTDAIYMIPPKNMNRNVIINTYNDHRMAMAFAPLSVITPITIENPSVVTKSFPDFWELLNKVGVIYK